MPPLHDHRAAAPLGTRIRVGSSVAHDNLAGPQPPATTSRSPQLLLLPSPAISPLRAACSVYSCAFILNNDVMSHQSGTGGIRPRRRISTASSSSTSPGHSIGSIAWHPAGAGIGAPTDGIPTASTRYRAKAAELFPAPIIVRPSGDHTIGPAETLGGRWSPERSDLVSLEPMLLPVRRTDVVEGGADASGKGEHGGHTTCAFLL